MDQHGGLDAPVTARLAGAVGVVSPVTTEAPPSGAHRSDKTGAQAARYQFKVADVSKYVPWYKYAHMFWRQRWGDSMDADYAIACRLGDCDLSTLKNYRSKWRRFERFCDERALCPLPAAASTLELYVGSLARAGTIKSTSVGQYVAAISKAHVHTGVTPPNMLGAAVNPILKGMAKQQRKVHDDDRVLYLPATVGWDVLVSALRIRDILQRRRQLRLAPLRDVKQAVLSKFRDQVALVFNLCDYGRADSQSKMCQRDVGVAANGTVVFRLRNVKNRTNDMTSLTFQWPPSALPGVRDLLDTYLWVRQQLGCGTTSLLWCLPWESQRKDTATFDALVRRVVSDHGHAPPDGFIYSSRSLRSGAVSNAAAIRVPMDVIRYMGGWKPDSAVPERAYLDRTCPDTDAAWYFFGWCRRDRVRSFPPPPPLAATS